MTFINNALKIFVKTTDWQSSTGNENKFIWIMSNETPLIVQRLATFKMFPT
jgi:hypothetical protein